jgi:hypothetical protein
MIKPTFGQLVACNIDLLMIRGGVTDEDLSGRTGIPAEYVAAYRQDAGRMQVDDLLTVAWALGVSVTVLMDDVEAVR